MGTNGTMNGYSQPMVYIVILNWNGWRDTSRCIESVMQLEYKQYKLVIVDNGSADDSVIQINSQINDNTKIVLIESKRNLGFSGGCNIGIDHSINAGADYIFLLNNDALVRPDTLTNLIDVASNSQAAIVGAKLLDEETKAIQFAGSRWPQQLFGIGKLQTSRMQGDYWPSAYASGCALLASRELLKMRYHAFGFYLDPALFMYCEEVDFCLYANSIGFSSVIANNSFVLHESAKSSGGKKNSRSYYYLTRNRILLANRWLGWKWFLLFHLYYLPSRFVIAIKLILSNNTAAARSIVCGLYDGYFKKTGIWLKHGTINPTN